MELQAVHPDVDALCRFLADHPQGLTQQEIMQAGWADLGQLMHAANVLLSQNRLALNKLPDGTLLYQATNPQATAKLKGLDAQHMMVYQLIEKAGNKGAWSKSLKDQSQLQQHTITKVTKELMRRQLVKEVKSVQNKNRKVFMLWDVEPAREVSGGTWYHDGEFCSSLIETLREGCQRYLEENHGRAVTLQDLHQFALQHLTTPQVPTEDDIASIMRTLELDEEVYSVQSATGLIYTLRSRGVGGQSFDVFASRLPQYLTKSEAEPQTLVVPCLSCPLVEECRPGGRICPERCEYITNWLRGASPGEPVQGTADMAAVLDDW